MATKRELEALIESLGYVKADPKSAKAAEPVVKTTSVKCEHFTDGFETAWGLAIHVAKYGGKGCPEAGAALATLVGAPLHR